MTGTNTLDFIVHNDGESPAGLRVDLSGTVYYESAINMSSTVSSLPTGEGQGPSAASSATSLGTAQSLAMSSSTASLVKSSSSSSQNSFDSALSSVTDDNVVAPSGIISLSNVVFDGPGLGKKNSMSLTS